MESQEQISLEPLGFRVTREMRAELERYAKEDSRTLANYLRLVLEQHIAQRRAEQAQAGEGAA